jgi:glutamate/tyrosine decarboxylase-like PLP-dependent enzyme
MVYLGKKGYLEAAQSMMSVADRIKKGIEDIPELILIGEPTFVISFRSDEIDVFHVNDFMKTKGWRFNVLQLPPALHFCVTMPQTAVTDIAEQLIDDLKSGVEYAKSKAGTTAETSALYGLAGTVETNQMVSELLYGFLDHFYTVY